MNKLFIICAISLLTCFGFSQHDRSHEHKQENHSRQENHRQEKSRNFTATREFINHRWSSKLNTSRHLVDDYLHQNHWGMINPYLHLSFNLFDCTSYNPIWAHKSYPRYFRNGRCHFPSHHIVWFEEPWFVPYYKGYFSVEMIDPLDVIVFQDGAWMYLQDYYRICVHLTVRM